MNTTIEFEIVPAELGLATEAKHSLETAFAGFFERARKWQSDAAAITDPKQARALRLEIKADRVEAEKTRKRLKEDSLRMGRAIDGANNIYLAVVTPIEQSLDDIEKAEQRRAAAAIESLREERAEALDSLGHVSHGINLGTLSEAEWKDYLQQAKDVFEVRQARAKREAEEAAAELKRQEEEREAQRLEAIRLREEAAKAEAAAKEEREAREKIEAQARAEREAAEKARIAAEAKAKAEREEAERAVAEERRKALEAAAAAAAKEARLQAEAQALRDAEAKRIADAKAADEARAKAESLAAKKAAAAPDKAKLMEFAALVRKLDVPLMKSADGRNVAADVGVKVDAFAKWIETQAATL